MQTPRAFRFRLSTTLAFAFLLPIAASMQTAAPTSTERARVPTSHANVHMSSGSGSEILILVPNGTVLTVIGRSGEWVQVQLSPELRKTGMVMRWYKNETSGWMHDSTVEITKAGTQ